jgi:hypothetical protein
MLMWTNNGSSVQPRVQFQMGSAIVACVRTGPSRILASGLRRQLCSAAAQSNVRPRNRFTFTSHGDSGYGSRTEGLFVRCRQKCLPRAASGPCAQFRKSGPMISCVTISDFHPSLSSTRVTVHETLH